MARKKKSTVGLESSDGVLDGLDKLSETMPTQSSNSASTTPNPGPQEQSKPHALVITRNKHWRYISAFHGPWLQLPPEVLESIAHNNYLSPRPRPIDPAVFYDLVKIRRAVDEASNLAVRATSGVTSSALASSLNAGHDIFGGGGAAGLGLGLDSGGTNAKLSPERRFRMRELATQKLCEAYRLDEIATSVATMEGASSIEDVAQFVLKRKPDNNGAKYVHFFHEKIPSRMMAQCTPLAPLDEIIASWPNDGAPLRTRAVTKIFKEDWLGAVLDLTEGLAITRYINAQHRVGRQQLVLARTIREEEQQRRNNGHNRSQDTKVAEEDQPSSLETQLLFHRANVSLTIACNHVREALENYNWFKPNRQEASFSRRVDGNIDGTPQPSTAKLEAHRRHLEARKIVKTYAKRAAKDYLTFLSHLDYTPGLPLEIAAEFQRRVNYAANDAPVGEPKTSNYNMPELCGNSTHEQDAVSKALVLRSKASGDGRGQTPQNSYMNGWPSIPPLEVHQVSNLFSATPPPNLPPYPPVNTSVAPTGFPSTSRQALLSAATSEAVTYHPLLSEVLHSLLLTHCLLQTSPTELRRHAHNVARISRLLDGYPVFSPWRSPARTDWVEVVRLTRNWIGLAAGWEYLCRPSPSPEYYSQDNSAAEPHKISGGDGPMDISRPTANRDRTVANGAAGLAVGRGKEEETEEMKRERIRKQAILDAISDERVIDEESFHRACRVREKRAWEWEEAVAKNGGVDPLFGPRAKGQDGQDSKKGLDGDIGSEEERKAGVHAEAQFWAQKDDEEYSIATERAEAIAWWVREAPLSVEGTGGKSKRGGKKKASKAAVAPISKDDRGVEDVVDTEPIVEEVLEE